MTYKYILDDAGKKAAKEYVKEWTDIAFKTGVMSDQERIKCKKAAKQLYINSGLTPPPDDRIIIVPSPMVARFVAGAASWIWYCRKNNISLHENSATDLATRSATLSATESATHSATDLATYSATHSATHSATDLATASSTLSATDLATRSATDLATRSATDLATASATDLATDNFYIGDKGCISSVLKSSGIGGLKGSASAYRMYQGGNMWAYSCAYNAFGRDYIKLEEKDSKFKDIYKKYQPWEDLAKISGFRFMHEEFCIISDRPIELHINGSNEPHNEHGPYIKWSDGSAIYAWNGQTIPARWIEDKGSITPKDALTWENADQRAAAMEIVGMEKVLKEAGAKTINKHKNPLIGNLVQVSHPSIGNNERFVIAHEKKDKSGRIFGIPVPPSTKTALEGQSFIQGLPEALLECIEVRT